MKTLLVALAAVNLALAQQCPPGFTASIYPPYSQTLCTKILPGTANRETAYNLCKDNGGELPYPNFSYENAALATVAGGDYWLRQNCIATNSQNQPWMNGSTCYFNDLGTFNGQGNLAAGTCLYGDSTGLWHNSDCFVQQAKVVCVATESYYSLGDSPYHPIVSRCFDGYFEQALYSRLSYNQSLSYQTLSYCYKYYGTPADYSTAETTCQRDGGHLASIRIAEENQFIKDLIYYTVGPFGGSSYTRIGLTKDNVDHKYTWASWVGYIWSNFLNPNYANGGASYDCVVMDSNGKWIPAPCTGSTGIGGFVCKRLASREETAI